MDPYREMNETRAATEFSGFTYSGREVEGKPTVKARIDYFLITQELYDYVEKAEILEEEIPSTDHKIIRMILNFVQFATGNGNYRCQNALLQDMDFCKVLKIQIEQRIKGTRKSKPNLKLVFQKTKL